MTAARCCALSILNSADSPSVVPSSVPAGFLAASAAAIRCIIADMLGASSFGLSASAFPASEVSSVAFLAASFSASMTVGSTSASSLAVLLLIGPLSLCSSGLFFANLSNFLLAASFAFTTLYTWSP